MWEGKYFTLSPYICNNETKEKKFRNICYLKNFLILTIILTNKNRNVIIDSYHKFWPHPGFSYLVFDPISDVLNANETFID